MKVPLCDKFKSTGTGAITTDTTQVLVGQNDAFAPVAIRQIVRKRVGTDYALSDIVSYPDLTLFNFAGEAAQIKGFFNGSLSELKVENTSVLENLPGKMMSYAGNTQLAAATYPSSGSLSEFEKYMPINKDILISGLTDAAININLQGFSPAAAIIGDSGVSGEQNDGGFEVLGFVIKGAGAKASAMASSQGKSGCVIR
jgi:hypothetical protein